MTLTARQRDDYMAQRAAHHNRPIKRDLTAREREILRYVGTGLRNKQIADRMGISVRTVENHIEHACVWLGVRSRIEAALRAGIVRIEQ